jgi:hypothetical protein
VINLAEQFNDCYLVMYSVDSDRSINALKALPFDLRTSTFGGTFLGVKGGGKYGIRFVKDATHLGIFDLSDTDNPKILYSTLYSDLELKKRVLIKIRGCFLVLGRGDKNFKIFITEHKTASEHRKSLINKEKEVKKLDPQTRKINNSLKNIKQKKA